MTTIIRRRKNRIERLKNDNGDWVENADDIKALAARYFSNLFTQTQDVQCDLHIPNLFPTIASVELDLLTRDVDAVEVKDSLFNIGSLKAPGADGFPASFYQLHWELCGKDIVDMVSKAFADCHVAEGLNDTLITLVPKVASPQSMAQFRPISLCCTLYKVLSKIIVARLRPLMSTLISPNQVSFVPGRQITDNILVAQELMHKFKNSKGRKGFIAWKVDLSKAYDRLNWNFIRVVLNEIGLPPMFSHLIMSCISTVRYQVCVNGELTDRFTPTSGIRQGDPLSPYLFVLCIEKLSHIIFDSVRRKKWKPVKSSQSGPFVSHLFFADDLILFTEASTQQARVMKDCLENFCRASGQTVNFDKSTIYCSPNTSNALATEISCICGSPLTENLGQYLGMPLLHSRVSRNTHRKLVDKVHQRLASWKSNLLSLAGRATLIQAVTAAIPVYAMQTAKLPVSTCKELDRVNRNFFWGGSANKQKVHLCQWDLICRPKSKGGFGFKKTFDMNQALLAKVGWRLHCKDEGLWAKIFESKYLKGKTMFDSSLKEKQGCSTTWKGVLHGADLLGKGMQWRIGKGDTARFWKDHWLSTGPLLNHTNNLTPEQSNCNINSFVKDGWWDIGKLRSMLSEDLVQQIISSPVGFNSELQDSQIWKPAANGMFTVKTAYELLFPDNYQVDPFWKIIWKLKIPPKIQIFFWLAYHDKISSNDQRAKRNLTSDPSCGICGWTLESALHILRDCPRAQSIWTNALPFPPNTQFFNTDLRAWICSNLITKTGWIAGLPWNIGFVFTCWYIWKWRNQFVFNEEEPLPFSPQSIILKAATDWSSNAYAPQSKTPKTLVTLAWEPPTAGCFKLNVDGSRKSLTGAIGAGGVIRNSVGEWITGFTVNLGKGQILDAELWGLFFGLKLAADKGIPNLVVEMDSATAVQLLQKSGSPDFHPLAGVLSDCRKFIGQLENCGVNHVYREQNCVADSLAKASFNRDLGIWPFDSPPDWIGNLLDEDAMGTSKSRWLCLDFS